MTHARIRLCLMMVVILGWAALCAILWKCPGDGDVVERHKIQEATD